MNAGRLAGFVNGKGLTSISPVSWIQTRFASKKATGGNRNPSQAPGSHRGIKRQDGTHVYPGDVLVYRQPRFWFHPGLNVKVGRPFLHLVAMKEGIVRVTCEKPDLNFKSNAHVANFYAGMEGLHFFKKYFNVVPKPQHTRFKCVEQI